jgi:RHS repeat-associated protein
MRPLRRFRVRPSVSVAVVSTVAAALLQAPTPVSAAPAEPAGSPVAAAAPAGPRDFFYDAAGQLVATSDGSEVAVNRYDDTGNLLRTERIPAAQTTIFALVPARGPVGTKVEIQGTGFSATAGANEVTVDGVAAPVTAATTNRLSLQVPEGTSDGVVRVTVGDATATSPKPFLVAPGAPVPAITALSTDRGNRNDLVTISGSGFDPVAARNVVMFHRTVARVVEASITSLTVRVPDAAASGRVTVRTPGGMATSAGDFLIAPRGFVMRDLVYAGRLTKDGPAITATIPAGKSALLLVDGTAGERLNIKSSNNTIPVRSALWMYTPYGGNFGRGSLGDPIDIWAGAPLSQDLPAMPATGTYAMVVKPNDGESGSVSLAVSTTLAGLTLTKNGAGVPFQITVPQQAAVFPFTAAANESLSLGLTELSEPTNHFVVTITAPDNTSVTWNAALAEYLPTMVYQAKTAGTYRLSVTFGPNELGFAKVWLSSVIDGPTLGINGAEALMRIERPGQSVRLPFNGTTGQNLQLGYSENLLQQNDRPYYPGALLQEPDGVQVELPRNGYAEARSLPTLRKTGTHYLLITGWQAVGTAKAWLSTAIEAGPLALNTRASVTIDRPGRDAYFDFDGVAGQTVSAGSIDNSIPGQVTLRLYRPNGSQVTSGRSFTVDSLPDTGRYRLQVDPESPGIGRVNVFLAGPVDLGVMAFDTALPAPITIPGQKVIGRFTGQAGQRLSIGTVTPAVMFLDVRVYTPDGRLWQTNFRDTRFGLDLPALPVDGEYRVEVRTFNQETTDLTVYLNTESDAGDFVVDGPNKTVAVPRPAQNVRMTFIANAGDQVDLNIVTLGLEGGGAFYYTLIGPDGKTLANHFFPIRFRERLPNLTATGVHTLILDPDAGATGTIELGLKNRITPATQAAGRTLAEPRPSQTRTCATEPESAVVLNTPVPGKSPTRERPQPRASDCQVAAGWTPDARNLKGDWTTGEKTAPPRDRALQFAVGVTGVVGKVLNTAGKPLSNVTVSAAGHKATTDAEGRFALADLSAGHVSLRVDGRGAKAPGEQYGVFDIGVQIERGQVLVLPYTVYLPQIDKSNTVSVPSPTTKEVVLTTKAIPGLEVHIPAGTVIRDADGKVTRELSLTPVPIDRPPFPLPPTKVPVYFSVQPGGGVLFPEGATIIYPNYTKEAPGTRTQFWNYDPDGKGWHIYGYGTVSKNGKQIVPDKNVKFYRLTGAMTAVPGMNPPRIAPRPNGVRLGDPVDPATGLLSDETVDMVVDDVMPIQIKRTYQQGDSDIRAFGVGMNFGYGMFPWSPGTIGSFDFQQFDLVQSDGSKIHYQRTSPGTDYAGAIFKADPTPTQYDGSTVAWNGDGWDVTLRDGTVIVLGDESPMQAVRDKYGNTTTITRATAAPGTDGKVRLNGAITQITSPSGRWVRFSYDSANPPRIASIEDNLGHRVSYTYDATGHLSTVTNPENGVTRYTWDSSGRLETITDPRQIRYLRNEYDDQGRVKLQEAADGGLTRFEYVSANDVVTETKVTDARGNVRRLTFNDKGQVLTDTRAYGTDKAQTTTTEYDSSGVRPGASIDALNRRTTFAYDGLGQLKEQTQLAGTDQAQTEKFERNGPHGELTKYTDSYGKSTVYELDGGGAVKSITDPMSRKTTYEVNAMGLVAGITDPAQKKTTIEYAGSVPVKVTDQLGKVSLTAFDPLGRPIRTVDPRGAATDTAYTAMGQVRSVTDPLGRTTEFDYNANGYLKTVTDARDGTTAYEYDQMDRVKAVTDPLGAAESMEYDANGNLTKHTSRRGIVTEQDYDELDRVTASRFGTESTVGYGYDAANRLRHAEDSRAGVFTTDYDGLDRVIEETSPQGEVSYSYSATVRDRTMTVAGSPTVRHVYDAAGDLAEVQRNGTAVTSVGRDTVGRQTRVGAPGNGVSQTYGYDDAGQVTSITYRAGTTVLGEVSYVYDAAGNPTHTAGGWSRTALPEPFGPATYNAANHLTAIGDTTVEYDPDGNLTSDGRTTYTWDARGRLSGLSREGLSVTFGYGADGRRTDRTIDGATTSYLYDGVNPVQEKVDGAVTATMTGSGVDGWQLRESGGTTKRYLTDALGSTLGLVDDSGAGAAYSYGPFGTTEVTGDDGGNPFRYTGREDDGTGLYYHRARYYSPVLQRFISEDPLGLASGDTNPYAYVSNQPTTLIDPMGTKPTASRGQNQTTDSCFDNSFTPGTEVQMADGSRRRIEDVEPDQKVLATDPETGRTVARTVTATITGEGEKHLVDVSVDNDGDGTADGTVTATDDHPFWVSEPGEWRDAKDINVGDLLRTSAGTHVQVTAVARRTAVQRVHNLTVDDLHTYYVVAGSAPVLVHNAGHSCTWQLRNSDGTIRTSGTIESGSRTPPGRRLSWDEQLTTHTEYKLMEDLAGTVKRGDIVSLQGTLPPCNPGGRGCQSIMAAFAQQYGVKVIYRQQGVAKPWEWDGR